VLLRFALSDYVTIRYDAWVQTTLGPGQAAHLARYMRQARPGMGYNYPRLFLTGTPVISRLWWIWRWRTQERGREKKK